MNTPKTNEQIVEELYKMFPDLLCNCHTDSNNYVGDHRAIVPKETINNWLRTILASKDAEKEEAVKKERKSVVREIQKIADTTPPNLLLNEIVNKISPNN